MSKEAVHCRLLLLQASACKTVLQSESCWCCKVGKAKLWHGPGDLCGGAAEGLCSLDCFGSLAVLRNRCQHCFHLLSVITGVLVSAMSCFSLQAEELCSAPSACSWEVACRQLEGS